MQISKEEHFEESLRYFSQGVEQLMMITVVPRYAAEDEMKLRAEEQLEEAGDMPAREMAAATLPQKEAGLMQEHRSQASHAPAS
jgi:hypothetical protein